jgi:hypothetical protein
LFCRWSTCLGATLSKKHVDAPPATTKLTTEVTGANPHLNGSPTPPLYVPPVSASFFLLFLRDIASFDLGAFGRSNPIDNNIGGLAQANSVFNTKK